MGPFCACVLTLERAVANEARQRIEYLLRHVFNTDPRVTHVTKGVQVVLSQLYQDLSLATGTELTLLRLERTADFNVLSLLATQLQAHQMQCEVASNAVASVLLALQGACERPRSDDKRQSSTPAAAAAGATATATAERGPGGTSLTDTELTPRRMYRDYLSDETEVLAHELTTMRACLAKVRLMHLFVDFLRFCGNVCGCLFAFG